MHYENVAVPVLVSFAISVIACPVFIPFLKRLKFGQFVRDDGPQSHLKKQGTPTMGGIIILLATVITSLPYMKPNNEIIPILFATVGFGIIGFLDDYLKVVMKRSMGLKAWQKMLGQIIMTAVFVYYYLEVLGEDPGILVPFTGGMENGMYISMPEWLFVIFVFFVMIGTVNGTNFTDGLDGLATSVTIMVAVFFTVVAIGNESGVTPVSCAVTGSLLGFLLYNVHPASVFMGDTGSLALGGFVASTAIMLKMPIFILIVGFIYLLEVVSVIIQVGYFKITHGKRIFKMAPIHHHFELCGWSETRVVTVFATVTALLCLVALAGV